MPPRSNTIRDVFAHYRAKIATIYPDHESCAILYRLTEHLFHRTRLDICLQPEWRLSESEIVQLYDAVKQILQHVPIQYVTGNTTFCGHSFSVNSSTLIPRPETEELVLWSLEQLAPNSRILDIGTGSGNIAIALKMERPDCFVSACDRSIEALETARHNATELHAEIRFFACNILTDKPTELEETYDVIISNPPYIPQSEGLEMPANVVQYEPHTALFVPDNQPLIFYESITQFASQHLSPQGKLFFEIHENYAAEVVELLENSGFHAELRKDVFGKNRMVMGKS